MSCPLREGDVNRVTSMLHLLTLLVTGTAMVQTGWFRIRGPPCAPHLGLAPFVGLSEYTAQSLPSKQMQIGDIDQEMGTENACISPRLVNMMRVIIFLCFDIIIFCVVAIFLNVSNLKNQHAKLIQRNGVMSIMTFVTVIMIIGVSFYVTVIIEEENSSNVTVSYDFGFYIIVLAGVLSIFNAAASLLSGGVNDMTIIVQRPLIEDWDGVETFNIEPSSNMHRTIIANSASFGNPPSRSRSSQHLVRTSLVPSSHGRNLDYPMLPPPPPYTP